MNKFDWHTEPAFSRPASHNVNNGEVYYENRGLSAWDYFAAAALSGLAGRDVDRQFVMHGGHVPTARAEAAANLADAMMLERAKRSTDAHAEWQASLKPQSSASSLPNQE